MAPTAKAERFISTPKKRPKEKKATNFTKKAIKYSKSDNMIFSVLKSEYISPKIKDITATKKVEAPAKRITV